MYQVQPAATCEKEVSYFISKWGNSASISIYDGKAQIFSIPQIEGCIGYRNDFGSAIVFGDPICRQEDAPILARAFHDYCTQQKMNYVYLTASEQFAHWAHDNLSHMLIEVGEELVLNPFSNPKKGSKGRSLRNKVNNAIRSGIEILEYTSHDYALENGMKQVANSWLNHRKGPQIFLAHVDLFSNPIGKRWFYAHLNGEIIGVLMLQQIQAQNGWLVHFLLSKPEAPIGCSELLITQAAEVLKEEACEYLTFGIAQTGELGKIKGLGRLSETVARRVFKASKHIFHLDKRRRYWRKFQPEGQSSYLVFSCKRIGLRESLGLMKALNVSL